MLGAALRPSASCSPDAALPVAGTTAPGTRRVADETLGCMGGSAGGA